MKMLYMLSIINEINKLLEKAKDWVQDNYANPVMWAAFVLVGLLVFQFTFSALQKEK